MDICLCICVCVYICETNQQYIGLATGVLHSSDKMTDICYALVYYWALCLGTADECDCSSQFIFLLRYLSSSEKADLKHSHLNRDLNPDLCDGSVVLHQLSCQANWELVQTRVDDIPTDDGYRCRYTMKYMNLTYLKNNVFMINSGFSVRQNQDSECHVSEIELRSSSLQNYGLLIHQ